MDRRTGTDDASLLDRVRGGDAVAFTTLYERYAIESITVAHSLAGCDADDVVHDVWLRVWTRPPVCRSTFRGWIHTSTRRHAIRHRRTRTRVGTLDDRDLLAGSTSPTRQVARQQVRSILEHAHQGGQLSTREFDALVDSTSDATPSELAAAQGVTRTGWLDRLRRAKLKLRKIALGDSFDR